jgi:L,D-peptidoglycan transpeptidase YkuD (ErfK/YbiS/YcfS/YnhG family)
MALAIGLTLAVSGCGAGGHSHTATPPTVTTTTVAVSTTSTSAPPTSVASVPPVAPRVTTTTTTAPHAACAPTLASRLASTERATQLITVDAATASTTSATVTLWSRTSGCWTIAGGPWSGRIGGTGFSDHHREGDQSTPTGVYTIGPIMYGNAANPGVRYSYHSLVCGDWWDEDPSSRTYNTFQHVACGQKPTFGGDSEALWQETVAYPSFAVIDYNTAPIVSGAGSAIFIHADVGGPTAGCVSLPVGELDTLLRWLQPAASPLIVMGPDAEIDRF